MKPHNGSSLLHALPGGVLTVWGALGALVFLLVWQPAPPVPPTQLQRLFPELVHVDKGLEEQLVEIWPRSPIAALGPEARANFAALAHQHGPAAARAILRRLFDQYAIKKSTVAVSGFAHRDQEEALPADLVGELSDPALRAAMVRALPERRLGFPFRLRLVIALCRPRHRAARDALVARVLDRGENNTLRREILERLDRFGGPAPQALHALLYQPFAHLDRYAAAALCLMGDPEAPTLVLEGLRGASFPATATADYFPDAARAVTGTTPVLHYPIRGSSVDTVIKHTREFLTSLSDQFEAWLDAHPEALDTQFERRRRALAGALRRKRALALRRFQDVVAAGEKVDIAAASMLLAGYPEDTRAWALDGLDRLAEFLRPKLAKAADPEHKIAVLNRWLTQRTRTVDAVAKRYGLDSFLPSILSRDQGNCLGCTTLYLAIADRLGLPLKPAGFPGHCFARWDDGKSVRDIETTDLGSTNVIGLAAGAPEPPTARRRQFLTWVLRNKCVSERKLRNFKRMATAARRILALDRTNLYGRVCLAAALFNSVLDSRTEVISLLDSALDQATPEQSVEVLATAAGYLLDYGEPSAALDDVARALRAAKHDLPRFEALEALEALKARCLAHLGRADEAEAILAVLKGDFFGVRLEVGTFAHPNSVRKCTREIGERARDPVGAHTTAALALLDLGEATKALELLDEVSEAEQMKGSKLWSTSPKGIFVVETRASRLQAYFLARALALHALRRKREARAAAARAKKLGRACRLGLRVESLLSR